MKYALLLLLFISCQPYKRVATDTNRTDKERKLLLVACESEFKPASPTFIKGKDSLRVDTFQSITTVIETKNDTVYITATKTVNIDKWHSRTDTITKEDTYKITSLQAECDKLRGANVILQAQHDEANTVLKTAKKRGMFGWVAFGVLVLLNGVYFYFKIK